MSEALLDKDFDEDPVIKPCLEGVAKNVGFAKYVAARPVMTPRIAFSR